MTDLEVSINNFVIARAKKKIEKFGLSSEDLNQDFSLTGSGVFDSMEFLELISDVETKFNIMIDFSGFEPEEFTTLRGFSHCASQAQED